MGIVAIIKAAKVDSLWNEGRYDEAEEVASSAKTWSFIAMGAGAVYAIFVFIFYFTFYSSIALAGL